MKVLDQAAKVAAQQKDEFVSCEHLLLALLDVAGTAKSLLEKFGVRRESAFRVLAQLRGSVRVTDETPESKFQVLEKYAINLSDKAKAGELDPVIGREEELRRLMQVLSRRTKNNPCLIGEPGVGKTAIVEGLAQRIASGDVPELLKGQAGFDARSRFAHRRNKVPRRVRRPLEGVHEGSKERRRADHPIYR